VTLDEFLVDLGQNREDLDDPANLSVLRATIDAMGLDDFVDALGRNAPDLEDDPRISKLLHVPLMLRMLPEFRAFFAEHPGLVPDRSESEVLALRPEGADRHVQRERLREQGCVLNKRDFETYLACLRFVEGPVLRRVCEVADTFEQSRIDERHCRAARVHGRASGVREEVNGVFLRWLAQYRNRSDNGGGAEPPDEELFTPEEIEADRAEYEQFENVIAAAPPGVCWTNKGPSLLPAGDPSTLKVLDTRTNQVVTLHNPTAYPAGWTLPNGSAGAASSSSTPPASFPTPGEHIEIQGRRFKVLRATIEQHAFVIKLEGCEQEQTVSLCSMVDGVCKTQPGRTRWARSSPRVHHLPDHGVRPIVDITHRRGNPDADEEEYHRVKDDFQSKLGGALVQEIWRVQNVETWTAYQATMTYDKTTDQLDERVLWHSSCQTYPFELCKKGFDLTFAKQIDRPAEKDTRSAYGLGFYFAEQPLYSHKFIECNARQWDKRGYYMVRVRVLLGKCEDLGRDMAEDRVHTPEGYDSWCGTEGDLQETITADEARKDVDCGVMRRNGAKYGKQYITQNNSRVRPEYIIRYLRE